ncbi:hypothetical protein LCGC14_1168740, partial [marine sediment metagenome]
YTLKELGDLEMVCGDCDELVMIRTMNFVVLTEDKMVEFKENLAKMAAYAEQEAKRKKLGLIVPGQEGQPPA